MSLKEGYMANGMVNEGVVQLIEGRDLDREQMKAVMKALMGGDVSPVLISAFLVAMRIKGITVDEIGGALSVMRSLSSCVKVHDSCAVDIVGTGGDGASLFNVSTAASLVCASAGVTIAKHGNRGFSSSSGSADVLEAAGVNVRLNADQVALCVKKLKIGFMFAQQYHPAMRHLAEVRKTLGFRTFMNLLGPLANPAGVKRQLLGVYDRKLCAPLAKVLLEAGCEHCMVVYSEDGLDEVSPAAKTWVVEVQDGEIREYVMAPEEFGIFHENLEGLAVASPADSLSLIRKALAGGTPEGNVKKAADMLALNAGAAIYISGMTGTLKEGVNKAKSILESGMALNKLESLAAFSMQFHQ